MALVETNQQSLVWVVLPAERPPAVLIARPGGVGRTLPVARFAADADLGPGRGEAIRAGVVILAQAGRVTLRAHEIPVLVQFRPVQDIVVFDLFIGIEMKPALTAFFFRSCVPGNRQRLNPAIRKPNEILLQRIDAKGVFHLELGGPAVRPVGFDDKLAVLSAETRMYAVVVETGVVEVAEYGFVGCVLHRGLVLRRAPRSYFRLVTPRTRLAADEACRRRRFVSLPP